MSLYRKKPVIIEAMQWDGTWGCKDTITARFPKLRTTQLNSHPHLRVVNSWSIETLEGEHRVTKGDYIIQGIKGEYYPCKPDIFELTYEALDE